MSASKEVPSAVIVELQGRYWQLKDQIKPERERAAKAQKAADLARTDADYLEHKLHELAIFLGETLDETEYFLSAVEVMTITREKCAYCAEEAAEDPPASPRGAGR